jgi:hypothetical protein
LPFCPLTAGAFWAGACERFLCNNHLPPCPDCGIWEIKVRILMGNGFWKVGHRPSTGTPLAGYTCPDPNIATEPRNQVSTVEFREKHIL